MVATLVPAQLKRDAVNFFRESDLPPRLAWIESLSPVHLRLFSVGLSDALKQATITGDEGPLLEMIADWKATAELDGAPEVIERIRQPKTRQPLESFINV
jgi:hypothetical protein